jgi:PAS domain S-box-containing protein
LLHGGVPAYSFCLLDRDGRVLDRALGLDRVEGYRARELVGRHFSCFFPSEAVAAGLPAALLRRAVKAGRAEDEGWRLRRDGRRFWARILIAALRDRGGRVRGFCRMVAVAEPDRLRQGEEGARQGVEHGVLVELAKRCLLDERLNQALALRSRREQIGLMVIECDAPGAGCGAGVPARIARCLRPLLREDDRLMHMGAGAFVMVLPRLEEAGVAAALAEAMIEALRGGSRNGLEAPRLSIGIALSPADGAEPGKLVSRAEAACRRAGRAGGGRYCFFDPAHEDAGEGGVAIGHELGRAVRRGELSLLYQPQFEIASGRLCGVEALVRWQHPTRGVLTPDRFLPRVEASQAIHLLDAWVLHEACRQARDWPWIGHRPVPVVVNVSARRLAHVKGLRLVTDALAMTGMPPTGLQLDLKDAMPAGGLDRGSERLLGHLGAWGVEVAIDDFGIGHDPLLQLKRLPARTIKIHRSFVRGIGRDPRDEAIVRSVIALARRLDMRVVAEGVETGAQLGFLRRHGCHAAQGFLLGRPVAPGRLKQPAAG